MWNVHGGISRFLHVIRWAFLERRAGILIWNMKNVRCHPGTDVVINLLLTLLLSCRRRGVSVASSCWRWGDVHRVLISVDELFYGFSTPAPRWLMSDEQPLQNPGWISRRIITLDKIRRRKNVVRLLLSLSSTWLANKQRWRGHSASANDSASRLVLYSTLRSWSANRIRPLRCYSQRVQRSHFSRVFSHQIGQVCVHVLNGTQRLTEVPSRTYMLSTT